MPAHVREARQEDAAIAGVHVDPWRTFYRGIVPEGFLADTSYENFEDRWRGWLRDVEDPHWACRVAELPSVGPDRRFRLRWPAAGPRLPRSCRRAVRPLSAARTPARRDRATPVWLGGTRPSRRRGHIPPYVGASPPPFAALLRGRGRGAARKPRDRDRRGKARGSSLRLAGHRSRRLPWLG